MLHKKRYLALLFLLSSGTPDIIPMQSMQNKNNTTLFDRLKFIYKNKKIPKEKIANLLAKKRFNIFKFGGKCVAVSLKHLEKTHILNYSIHKMMDEQEANNGQTKLNNKWTANVNKRKIYDQNGKHVELEIAQIIPIDRFSYHDIKIFFQENEKRLTTKKTIFKQILLSIRLNDEEWLETCAKKLTKIANTPKQFKLFLKNKGIIYEIIKNIPIDVQNSVLKKYFFSNDGTLGSTETLGKKIAPCSKPFYIKSNDIIIYPSENKEVLHRFAPIQKRYLKNIKLGQPKGKRTILRGEKNNLYVVNQPNTFPTSPFDMNNKTILVVNTKNRKVKKHNFSNKNISFEGEVKSLKNGLITFSDLSSQKTTIMQHTGSTIKHKTPSKEQTFDAITPSTLSRKLFELHNKTKIVLRRRDIVLPKGGIVRKCVDNYIKIFPTNMYTDHTFAEAVLIASWMMQQKKLIAPDPDHKTLHNILVGLPIEILTSIFAIPQKRLQKIKNIQDRQLIAKAKRLFNEETLLYSTKRNIQRIGNLEKKAHSKQAKKELSRLQKKLFNKLPQIKNKLNMLYQKRKKNKKSYTTTKVEKFENPEVIELL